MKLSTKTRYGARALVELALNYRQSVVPVNVIAKKQNISERYLQNILLMLVDAGIVVSVRGKKGGFELAKPPREISLGSVVRTLEEEDEFVECVKDKKYCSKTETCVMYDIWKNSSEAFFKYFDNITLEDIMRMHSEKETGLKILDYSI